MAEETRDMRVLVVDEQLVADTLVLILKQAGLKARAAYSGSEARTLTHAFGPDALITDGTLDGMSGLELAMEIARSFPRCRILLFSGLSPCDVHSAEASGYDFTLVNKPVHPKVILDWLDGVAPARPQSAWQ